VHRRKEETVENPWIVIAGIVAVAVVYVLLPVAADTFRRFRVPRILRCPETEKEAEVALDAPHAALTSAFGPPVLRVKNCSLWPEREDCPQDCLAAEAEAAPPSR
jgi:hypothetical protein